MAGEENPADLFTKHLESAAKLKQLMGLFSCQFVQGRAVSAPNLKKSAAGVEMVAFAQLPHLMPTQVMNDKFPVVHPVNENYGEVDIPVEEELGDPVPLLTRSAPGSSRARAKRAGGAGREPRDDAHLVTDTGCPDDLNGPGPWGAGSVGRCLGEHSLRYATVHSLADGAAAGARHQQVEHATTTVEHATTTVEHATTTVDCLGATAHRTAATADSGSWLLAAGRCA